MRIFATNIQNNKFLSNQNNKKIPFGSSNSWYDLNEYQLKVPMGNFTNMFRNDVDWLELAKYEHKLFKNKDKINVVQFAASSGAEAYSKIISLLETGTKRKAKKFFPIQAIDIDSNIVDIAKSGLINLDQNEISDFASKKLDIQKYFKPYDYNLPLASCRWWSPKQKTYVAQDILKNNVNFSVGDMFKTTNEIQDNSNSIILCRNSLGYFNPFLQENFVQAIAPKLKDKSLVIIGELEADSEVVPLLQEHNFKEIMKNVFQKRKSNK